jgi:hypothetical protein
MTGSALTQVNARLVEEIVPRPIGWRDDATVAVARYGAHAFRVMQRSSTGAS